MKINVILRVDDIKNRFDFIELKNWFLKNYPRIPVCFYACNTNYKYMWKKSGWKSIKDVILNYNWEIGGHSRNHKHLNQIPKEDLEKEIGKNIEDIENGLKLVGLNYKVTSFAYPYGDFNENVKQILRKYKIIHGLTYSNAINYKSQIKIPENNLFEINISCNAKNLVEDWNLRFNQVYNENGTYILCLHTPHWLKGNLKRIFINILQSKSLKASYMLLKDYFSYKVSIYYYKKEKSQLNRWNMLKEHLSFILTHHNVQFITFKDLIKK